jgi:3-methyladenine DNA glycosylase AlkD
VLVADREWFVQKAIGWWLRSLSVRDPDRVRAFLDGPGQGLRPFARREALRRLA